jgi:hypothetical protein
MALGATKAWAVAVIMVITMLELYLGTLLMLKQDLRLCLLATTGLFFLFVCFFFIFRPWPTRPPAVVWG